VEHLTPLRRMWCLYLATCVIYPYPFIRRSRLVLGPHSPPIARSHRGQGVRPALSRS